MQRSERSYSVCARLLLCAAALALVLGAVSCGSSSNAMKDGYYTAEMADFDSYGWKEFVILYVKNDKIVSVDYNAKNVSGFIKSWDMDYMRTMNATDGTYPNQYVRIYTDALLDTQDPGGVDAVTGATHSHVTFVKLAAAAMEQARTGQTAIAYVEN